MNNLKMFCLTMEPNHLKIIKEFNYLPVGLGKKDFSADWIVDNKGDNISQKMRITESIHFIIGYGEIIQIKLKIAGLVFVNTENFGAHKMEIYYQIHQMN